ncbi:MAG TPA: PQQ-binding-like beta-propeller repeat protein [Bryobacteraceae bacterium]|nr:PQQ-binding-like beta-propeller repeat protein [Bryobacteraceae bacterium]
MNIRSVIGLALVVGWVIASASGQQKANSSSEWRSYGGDKGFTRYSPLDQVNRDNVKNLRIVWRRPALDPQITEKFPDLVSSNYFRGTPIIVNGVLYAPDGVGLVEAFDAATGQTKWVQQPVEPTLQEAAGQSTRGVAYWQKQGEERIVSIRRDYLYAMDAKTGKPCADFGENGRVWLSRHTPDNAGYFGFPGPFVVNDVIVVGGNGGGKTGEGYGDDGFESHARPEDIRGYDMHTGKQLWTFHVLPHKGEPGYDTWGKGSAEYMGNMAAWGSMTADEQLGYVYVPLSAPTVSYYGGHRPGKNLYSDSLVVLNAKTGKLVWYFQMVHHDLWDYDSASPPVLADITVDGKRIKAVIASNKTGFLYVFNRVTGKPVWPIVERPVPQSTTPGEETSPTQPFPTKPPAYDRQGFTADDLIDFTPELHQKALEIASHYQLGPLFTPPSLMTAEKKGTLAMPSAWGAGNWNTGALDPETGIYYAVSMTQPTAYGLVKATNPKATMAYWIPFGEPDQPPPTTRPQRELLPGEVPDDYTEPPDPLRVDGLPLMKPPYGRITAIDMNTGSKLWMVPNGDGPRNNPVLRDLNLPPLGNLGRPVALVTKTLLFLGDASNALFGRAGIAGPAKFRAYDKASGALLWQMDLPVGLTGGPMTYMADGRQMIVLPIGGKGYGAGWVALALTGQEVPAVTSAPAGGSVAASFNPAQAQQGQTVFENKCATCHGSRVEGGEHAPALSGNAFWSQWDQQTARALYGRIISTMPPDAPGTLSESDAIDVVSYILKLNGAPQGSTVENANQLNRQKLGRPQ